VTKREEPAAVVFRWKEPDFGNSTAIPAEIVDNKAMSAAVSGSSSFMRDYSRYRFAIAIAYQVPPRGGPSAALAARLTARVFTRSSSLGAGSAPRQESAESLSRVRARVAAAASVGPEGIGR
jgi:hypothetical protein